MSKGRSDKAYPLLAAAVVASASGAMIVAAPAGGMPPAPTAPPGGCAQWGFPGETTFTNAGGVALRFNSTGPTAGGPAEFNPNGVFKRGTVAGGIDPNGAVNVTFTDDDVDDPGSASFLGTVGPDGKVTSSNTSWTLLQPMTCVTKAEVKGPTITSTTVLGGIVIHVKDNSGVTAQCHYDSEFFDRDFTLQANSTADVRLVPAAPLLRTWPVTVSCDNGTSSNADIFF
jgi:hypothetical protein